MGSNCYNNKLKVVILKAETSCFIKDCTLDCAWFTVDGGSSQTWEGRQKCVIFRDGFWYSKDCAANFSPLCQISNGNQGTTAYPPTVPPLTPCSPDSPDDGWIVNPKNKDFCYYFSRSKDKMNFWEASRACEKNGGQLVSIHSDTDNDFMTSNADSDSTWVGLNEIFVGEWRWTDRSDTDYFRWSPGGFGQFPYWKDSNNNNLFLLEPSMEGDEEDCAEFAGGSGITTIKGSYYSLLDQLFYGALKFIGLAIKNLRSF